MSGAAALPAAQSTPAALRVFFVEDNRATIENVTALLAQTCPLDMVDSAADEATALMRIPQAHGAAGLDLLIINVYLKEGSGLGLLTRLADVAAHVPRVVLTNYAQAEVRQACLALGAARCFDKSTELEALADYCNGLHASRTH